MTILYQNGSEWNHDAAACALATKLGWDGAWYSGALPDGSNVYVLADTPDEIRFTVQARSAA